MANLNLLELNVDALFEQHNVGEIDAINKRIQGIIEQKREELRTMVGERYRDLLKAADTITAMQETSGSLIKQIDNVNSNCKILNEQQLIGFKTHEAEDILRNRKANKQRNNYFSTMVQIKLLIALPELIWSHLDLEHFYKATELFIFSRHISTGLQLDANNALMQKLPIVKKQWEMLKPFQTTIKKHIVKTLENENLNEATTVDCLLSLTLLEKNDLNGILRTLLKLRVTAFNKCLNDNYIGTDQERRLVKDRILASIKILNGTIELLSQCFTDKGILLKSLKALSDPNTSPTITLMDPHESKYAYILPDIISNFKPKIELPSLNKNQARTDIEQWSNEIDSIIKLQLQKLFDLIGNLKTIQEIKTEAFKLEKNFNFSLFLEEFSINDSLNFYKDKYSSLLNKRARDIVRDNLSKTIEKTFQNFKDNIENNEEIQEIDIWSDIANDLPLSLAEALSNDHKNKHLLMKSKGYGPAAITLCSQFDKNLKEIIDEIDILLSEETTKSEEKIVLIDFLRETTEYQMTHFLSKIKSLNLSNQQRKELLFIVRACAALIELCPSLKLCFCQHNSWYQWTDKLPSQNKEYWSKFCRFYDEEIFRFWEKLVESILEEYHCSKHLAGKITHEIILADFALWEMITLDEKDEQDNAVQSTFRIPKQPSISLQTYIFTLIRELNQTIPQTMPTKVLNYFNNKLLTQILQHYQQQLQQPTVNPSSTQFETPSPIATTTTTTTTTRTQTLDSLNNTSSVTAISSSTATQNVALQMYFDLKFLQSIFNISRDDRILLSQFSELQNAFKDMIDPFDYELFAEHISANVKRSVSRLNCALGVLVSTDMAITALTTSTTAATIQEKEPNVLSLSSCGSTSLWFPLLPIVTTNYSTQIENSEAKKFSSMHTEKSTTPTKQKSNSQQRKSDTTKSKSFFGAMSQEWFR